MFLKILFYLCLFSIILGPLGVIPLGIPQINVYFTDIVIGLIGLIWIFRIKDAIKLVKDDPIARYFCIFAGIGALSLLFSPMNLSLNEKFVSGLYIVRLLAYFSVYLTVRFLTDSSTSGESLYVGHPRGVLRQFATSPSVFLSLLVIIGIVLAIIGWLQYFFYPDLRNLYYLGWDPHFKRIFSTFLDPNYFGLMMALTLIVIARRNATWQSLISVFLFLTLMFTYSRSSFLALIGAVIYFYFAKKNFKLIGGIIAIIFISVLLLPRPGGVGVQLERVFSIETRIGNWQQAMKIFADHPILGVGFNTVRYAKKEYNFGQDNLSANHAGAGFDNSFLFIGATTGLVGLLSFLFFLFKIYTKGNLLVRTSLIAIIIHSFFLNSLFFPWVMVWMWMIIAVASSHSENGGDPSPPAGGSG